MPKVGVFMLAFLSSCYTQCSSIREEHLKLLFSGIGAGSLHQIECAIMF